MQDTHLEEHLKLDAQSIQVQALTQRASLALDTLNFCQAVAARNTEHANTFEIPKERELSAAAVQTLLLYFSGPSNN